MGLSFYGSRAKEKGTEEKNRAMTCSAVASFDIEYLWSVSFLRR